MVTADEIRTIVREEVQALKEDIRDEVKKQVDLELKKYKVDLLNEAKQEAKQQAKAMFHQQLDAFRDEFLKCYEFTQRQEKDILDMQVHSMKYDLLIGGIAERSEDENYQSITNDVMKFLRDTMKVDVDVLNDLQFKAIHRLGRKSNIRPRNIIVVVNKLQYIAEILKKGKNLKNTNFTVRTHLPKILAEYRTKVLNSRREMISSDASRRVRVVEIKGNPHLQEKRLGGNWETVEHYYAQNNRFIMAPRFTPLNDTVIGNFLSSTGIAELDHSTDT